MDRAAAAPPWTLWPALLVSPTLVLTHLAVVYALVWPACVRQDTVWLHGLTALSLLLTLTMTALAWRSWRRLAGEVRGASPTRSTASDVDREASRPLFVALVATLAGALASLVLVAMWLPLWVLPPCA